MERTAGAVPAGDILVSIARRSVAFTIDLFMIGLPLLLGAVDMAHRAGTLTGSARAWLAVEAAVMTVLYHGIGVGRFGRTIGKAVMQCRVVRSDDGGRTPWSAAFIRAVILALVVAQPWLVIPAVLVVYGAAFVDPLQRGLHDRAAGTIVVLD